MTCIYHSLGFLVVLCRDYSDKHEEVGRSWGCISDVFSDSEFLE